MLAVRDHAGVERDPMPASPMLTGTPPPGMFDQDPPHCLRRSGKKMAPAVPVLGLSRLHESEIGLVDQRRGLEGLPRMLPDHQFRCQPVELGVQQRQQILQCLGFALLVRRE